MITLTLILITLAVLGVLALLGVLTLGGGLLIVFGDVIACVAIVWFIFKLFGHKKKGSK
jgi:hypothetical protein